MFINLNKFKTSSVYKAISSLFLDFTATNTLDDRVTFSRTSNATVTNSAGLVTYAPHNLMPYSEQFDSTGWGKANVTVNANTTIAPNGTSTADKLVDNTTNGFHRISYNVPSVVSGISYTFSVYLKADGITRVGFSFGGSFFPFTLVNFNLSNGTVASGTGIITAVGDGWYRCSRTIVASGTGSSDLFIELTDASGNRQYIGNGTNGAYVWGAQLEVGASPTAYNPTTVKNLLGFTEAFDNAAWTKSNSFVQTNLVLQSEDFDNAAWTTSAVGVSATANANLAPNGYQTADTIIENSATSSHLLVQGIAAIAGQVTYSVYAKAGAGNRYLTLSVSRASTHYASATFDLATQTQTQTLIAGYTGSVTTSVVASNNGFYRYSFTVTTDTLTDFRIGLSATSTFTNFSRGFDSYTGNGASSIILWGAQLVQGAVAGDYRRTGAAALPVFYPNQNGVVCAEKLVENTANTEHQIDSGSTTGVLNTLYTLSAYVKSAERTRVRIFTIFGGGNGVFADVNIGAGTIGAATAFNTATAGTSSIVAVGNGWYRVSVSGSSSASTSVNTRFEILNASGNRTYTGDGSSGILIFGAQLSDSASLDPYVLNAAAASTAAAYYGPRFDYDPVTLQPKGLLIEEQRTNLLTYSEQFDNAAWVKSDTTVSANLLTSPDGTLDADKLIENTATSTHSINQLPSITSGTSYTLSCYAKAGERNFVQLLMLGGFASNITAIFDLTTGAVGATNGSPITQAINVGNGWWRFSITATATSTVTTSVQLRPSNSSTTAFYTGDGTSGIFIWGAQLEAGAFATSYIPTVASQVTRTADNASIQGSNFYSWYNQNEGTVRVSYDANPTSGSDKRLFLITDSSGIGVNSQFLFISNATQKAGSANTFANSSNIGRIDASPAFVANTLFNTAYAYAIGNRGVTASGTATSTSSASYNIGILDRAFIAGTDSISGHIKSISYYNTRLSNATLQSITS